VPLIKIQQLALAGKLEEQFPIDKKFYVHCKSGARSLIASSILRKHGYHHVVNVEGGYSAIRQDNHVLKFTA
jgi:rhodanese-related sulfurtransferase